MALRVQRLHDAPWLRISDEALAHSFFARFGISLEQEPEGLLRRLTEAFQQLPFENLTKIIKADSMVNATSAMRYPDEVIGDFLRWGTGGTCFSLTAAMVALLDAVGIDALPILADRHYGSDTHCGLMIVRPGAEVRLMDPGYLVFTPVAAPRQRDVSYETGFNRVELRPIAGGSRVELYTVVKGNRKLRLTFKLEPVSDEAFRRFWERSFCFEMMNYPVLTRQVDGRHQYLQGNVLALRNARRTERSILTQEMQIDFISGSVKIHRDIAIKALEIIRHGNAATAVSG